MQYQYMRSILHFANGSPKLHAHLHATSKPANLILWWNHGMICMMLQGRAGIHLAYRPLLLCFYLIGLAGRHSLLSDKARSRSTWGRQLDSCLSNLSLAYCIPKNKQRNRCVYPATSQLILELLSNSLHYSLPKSTEYSEAFL